MEKCRTFSQRWPMDVQNNHVNTGQGQMVGSAGGEVWHLSSWRLLSGGTPNKHTRDVTRDEIGK